MEEHKINHPNVFLAHVFQRPKAFKKEDCRHGIECLKKRELISQGRKRDSLEQRKKSRCRHGKEVSEAEETYVPLPVTLCLPTALSLATSKTLERSGCMVHLGCLGRTTAISVKFWGATEDCQTRRTVQEGQIHPRCRLCGLASPIL